MTLFKKDETYVIKYIYNLRKRNTKYKKKKTFRHCLCILIMESIQVNQHHVHLEMN